MLTINPGLMGLKSVLIVCVCMCVCGGGGGYMPKRGYVIYSMVTVVANTIATIYINTIAYL